MIKLKLNWSEEIFNFSESFSNKSYTPNLIIKQTMNIIKKPESIILFHGKRSTDDLRKNSIIIKSSKVTIWSDIQRIINQYQYHPSLTISNATHIHNNDLKIGDMLLLIVKTLGKSPWNRKRMFWQNTTRNEIYKLIEDSNKPLVITNPINENWGFLSDSNYISIFVPILKLNVTLL